MACGCGRRARAKVAGEEIAGYRVVLDGVTYPPLGTPAFMSPSEARSKIRDLGGGTAYTETRQSA